MPVFARERGAGVDGSPGDSDAQRRRPGAHARRRPGRQARRAGRRAGGAGGRDDARRLHLGGRGAQPRGPDRAQLRTARALGEAPPPLAPAGDPRRRCARRVAEDRLPGSGDLRQRADGGGRGGSEGGDRRLDLGRDDRPLAGAGGRPLLRGPGRADQPDQGPARLAAPLLADRGVAAHGDLHRLHRRDQPPARPAARLRVPRRRAQDDLLLRGRRRAGPVRAPSCTPACTRAAAPASC